MAKLKPKDSKEDKCPIDKNAMQLVQEMYIFKKTDMIVF